MINNKYLRDAIVTAVIFMVIKLVIGNDYSQEAFLKVELGRASCLYPSIMY